MTLREDIQVELKRLHFPVELRASEWGGMVWLDAEPESMLFYETPLLEALKAQKPEQSPEDIWDAIADTAAAEIQSCGHPVDFVSCGDEETLFCAECEREARHA